MPAPRFHSILHLLSSILSSLSSILPSIPRFGNVTSQTLGKDKRNSSRGMALLAAPVVAGVHCSHRCGYDSFSIVDWWAPRHPSESRVRESILDLSGIAGFRELCVRPGAASAACRAARRVRPVFQHLVAVGPADRCPDDTLDGKTASAE